MPQKSFSKIVVFISGASSGIGKSTAEYLSQLGYTVYGTSRRPEAYPEPEHYTMLKMDVRDEASVKDTVEGIILKEGRIDVLVNNAGYGIGAAIEDSTPKMAEEQIDTNFFGMYRVQHYVLKQMKAQESGLIINISSIGGVIGLPYQGLYSASKFAVEGMTEALYKEFVSRSIRVCMIEPGDFKTGFTANRENIKNDKGLLDKSRKIIEHDEQNGQPPIKIAKLIAKIILMKKPKLRYAIGAFDQKLSIFLKKILPNRWFDAIIIGYYKVGSSGK
ncbi:MAG: SDR family NAD(P)-dependent oxidoreductase [Candidatus Marinimicrobia bacterium]|nr:SDR family NAD(P)-dependent oxidoreductase [Candidatus Neomarinimicrobiota bacterium]